MERKILLEVNVSRRCDLKGLRVHNLHARRFTVCMVCAQFLCLSGKAGAPKIMGAWAACIQVAVASGLWFLASLLLQNPLVQREHFHFHSVEWLWAADGFLSEKWGCCFVSKDSPLQDFKHGPARHPYHWSLCHDWISNSILRSSCFCLVRKKFK